MRFIKDKPYVRADPLQLPNVWNKILAFKVFKRQENQSALHHGRAVSNQPLGSGTGNVILLDRQKWAHHNHCCPLICARGNYNHRRPAFSCWQNVHKIAMVQQNGIQRLFVHIGRELGLWPYTSRMRSFDERRARNNRCLRVVQHKRPLLRRVLFLPDLAL